MYEKFVESQVKVSAKEPIDEDVWIKKSKNLFNINGTYNKMGDDSSYQVSGNTLTVTGLWYAGQIINVESNTDYTLSATSAGRMAIYTGSGSYMTETTTVKTFNSGSNTQIILYFYTGGQGSTSQTATFTNIQLEKGASKTEYEPFVEKAIHTKNDNGVFEEFINVDNKLESYYFNTNDSKFTDVTQLIGNNFQADKMYVISNAPIADDTYIQGGRTHTVIGCEFGSRAYAYQLSLSSKVYGIKFRRKDAGAWGAWQTIAGLAHPVGTVIITSTNTNPAADYGGTWELIDKEFSSATISNPFSINTTNTNTGGTYYAYRAGHSINFFAKFVNKVAFTDSSQQIGTFDFSTIGISALPGDIPFVGYSDGGNSMLQLTLNGTSGALHKVDVEYNLTSVAASNTWLCSTTATIPYTYMLDEACDKFYWKRTA